MDNMIVGIDPGKSGGAIITNGDGDLLLIHTDQYHFIEEMTMRLKFGESIYAGIEHVHAFPGKGVWDPVTGLVKKTGQGVTSAFTFGENFGQWQGILMALPIPYVMVSPPKWRSILDSKQKGKEIVVDYVKRRWPRTCHALKLKKNWWIADAMCIATWARQHLGLMEVKEDV